MMTDFAISIISGCWNIENTPPFDANGTLK
jgi:hypothetical protein